MSHDPNDPLAARARALFDRAADGVDAAVAARLRTLRREAVHGRERRRVPARWSTPVALAAAFVVAFGTAWWITRPTGGSDDAPVPAEVAALAGDPAAPAAAGTAEIARLLDSEDPDLYAWLADAPVAPAGSPP